MRHIYSICFPLSQNTAHLLNAIKDKKPLNKVQTPTPIKNSTAYSQVGTSESI